jgi:large subunit ribosomal protein L10
VPTQEKVETIEDLKSRLKGVKTVLLAEYRGLTVSQLSDLRKQLKAVSAEYKIVKNRLARLAIASSDVAELGTALTGPTGMVLAKGDPVSVAKTLQTFARTHQALVLKIGVVDGQMLEPAGLKALADLPSREALRAQLVGALQGPLAQLVGLLQAPQRELVYVLEQRGSASRAGASGEASRETEGSARRAGASGEASRETEGSASRAGASGEASREATETSSDKT